MFYTVGWLFGFFMLGTGIAVPTMWPISVWGVIWLIFMTGAKPLEEAAHSDNVVEAVAGTGGAVLWVLLTLGAIIASIFIIGGGA